MLSVLLILFGDNGFCAKLCTCIAHYTHETTPHTLQPVAVVHTELKDRTEAAKQSRSKGSRS